MEAAVPKPLQLKLMFQMATIMEEDDEASSNIYPDEDTTSTECKRDNTLQIPSIQEDLVEIVSCNNNNAERVMMMMSSRCVNRAQEDPTLQLLVEAKLAKEKLEYSLNNRKKSSKQKRSEDVTELTSVTSPRNSQIDLINYAQENNDNNNDSDTGTATNPSTQEDVIETADSANVNDTKEEVEYSSSSTPSAWQQDNSSSNPFDFSPQDPEVPTPGPPPPSEEAEELPKPRTPTPTPPPPPPEEKPPSKSKERWKSSVAEASRIQKSRQKKKSFHQSPPPSPRRVDANSRLFGLDHFDQDFEDEKVQSAPSLRSPKSSVIVNGNESANRKKVGSRSLKNVSAGKKKSDRRLSLSDTFTISNFDDQGRFPVLPPLVRQDDPEGNRLGRLEAEKRLSRVMPDVPDRSIDSMLRELRTLDRDRDRIMPTKLVSTTIQKYQLPIKDVLTFLLHQFADTSYEGMVNYEDLVSYLNTVKRSAEKAQQERENNQGPFEHDINKKIAERKQNASETSSSSTLERKSAFMDRDEAKLILELEAAIQASPKFEFDKFRESLLSKDVYDNGTVSRQHVIQAVSASRFEISNEVLGRWLSTCETVSPGKFSISRLVSFLERGKRSHLLDKRRQ